MVSIPQSSYSFSPNTIRTGSVSSKTPLFSTVKLYTRPAKSLKFSSLSDSNFQSSLSKPDDVSSHEDPEAEAATPDPVKMPFFEKAKTYKKSQQAKASPLQVPVVESPGFDSGNENEKAPASDVIGSAASDIPDALRLAMEKAKEYKKNKEATVTDRNVGKQKMKLDNMKDEIVEDGTREKGVSSISKIDFLGFGFSDKKSNRGIPPGLVPIVDTIVEGDMPEVELIVGDTSKFGVAQPSNPVKEDDNADLYKPKVSTWGVFPRPGDISKTFGGGRTIQPGEVLETAEDKAAKQARTKQLIAAYKSKMGLNIDAKVKADCEKALQDGNSFMDRGKLREALPYYEKVMKAVVFQSEVHGLAALQWSICQDSLSRQDEARVMYEKLQSHPNTQVSKKARQFVFSFQAMEMMKVTSS